MLVRTQNGTRWRRREVRRENVQARKFDSFSKLLRGRASMLVRIRPPCSRIFPFRGEDKMIDKNKLTEIKNYIERVEKLIEHEWGSCRSIEELINANKMPQIYYDICRLLE